MISIRLCPNSFETTSAASLSRLADFSLPSSGGSGLLRRMLYLAALRSIHLEGSAFGAYYYRLVERGLKKGSALMAVMRKMLAVAAHLLMHEEESYDPRKVSAGAVGR